MGFSTSKFGGACAALALIVAAMRLPAQKVYVINISVNTVTVIDSATNAVTATIPVGMFPTGIVATPDGSKVYVVNTTSQTISVIDASSNTVSKTIPLGGRPGVVGMAPDGKKVYVATGGTGLTVLDTNSDTVTSILPVSGVGFSTGMGFSPDSSKLYVVGSETGVLSSLLFVVDATTGGTLASIPVGGQGGVDGATVSPDGKEAFTTNDGLGGNTVSVIDTATYTTRANVGVGSLPGVAAISPDGSKVYVTNGESNTVSIFSTATNQVTATVPVGMAPLGLAILQDGSKYYVANENSNTLSVMDTATNNVLATISTRSPYLIAIPAGSAATTTALTSDTNPASVGKAVTLTATITANNSASPTGTVIFKDGTTVLATVDVSGGSATCSATFTSSGKHSLTASYSGDKAHGQSISPALDLPVNLAMTTVSVTSSNNPSTKKQQVTITATVSSADGAIPDRENVIFSDGTTMLATMPLAGGMAMYSTSELNIGSHTISVAYTGDDTFQAAMGSLMQVVNPYSTSTTLVSSLPAAVYGESVVLIAKVTSSGPKVPTGKVLFQALTGPLGIGKLSGGVAVFKAKKLPIGLVPIVAFYGGDTQNQPSNSAALKQVEAGAVTRLALKSSKNPAKAGEMITFTANVISSTGATPVGSVTFSDGSSVLGTVALTSGKATLSTATLPSGSEVVKAAYSGNVDFVASSEMLTQVVR